MARKLFDPQNPGLKLDVMDLQLTPSEKERYHRTRAEKQHHSPDPDYRWYLSKPKPIPHECADEFHAADSWMNCPWYVAEREDSRAIDVVLARCGMSLDCPWESSGGKSGR